MDYARMMAALRRRRLIIATAVLGCTALTFAASARMKREYQASATLMPQERALSTLQDLASNGDHPADPLDSRQDRIKTISEVLNSPAVLSEAIRKVRLKLQPAQLQEQMEVKPVTSQVLRVSVRDVDPRRAEATVNAIVDTFVTFFGDLRSRESRKQLQTLAAEREQADRELRAASQRLEAFKRNGGISSLPDQTKAALDRATQIEEQRNGAQARLREVTAQITSTEQALGRTPRQKEIRESASQTTLVDRLRGDVHELQGQLTKELAVHTDEHDNVKRLKTQLAEAQARLDAESNKLQTTVRVVANPEYETLQNKLRDLRSEAAGLGARTTSLNASLARLQSQVTGYAGKDVEESLLTQRYTLAEQRLAGLDARLMQLKNAAATLTNGQPILVVDQAGKHNPAEDLSKGRAVRLTVLAFILSLATCVALAVGLEYADRRVKTVEDAERLTELPVVSVVPQLGGRASEAALCLTTENNPSSHLAEAYHFLANHILRQTLRRESTVLMGATARPGQGATTSLCNLAVALARAGRTVVLVDADLRRPSLHEVFINDTRCGLTDVLRDQARVGEALVETHVENLRLLQAGSTARDPWSLLWQPTMARVIEELRDQADYVIFNVPSATVFADALCVAPHVDGAILVMRSSEMPNGAEKKVREWLDEVNVPVMGVVLNGVPQKEMETFDFHRSYTARRANGTGAPALGAPKASAPPVRRVA